jgi:hypothetical protein
VRLLVDWPFGRLRQCFIRVGVWADAGADGNAKAARMTGDVF